MARTIRVERWGPAASIEGPPIATVPARAPSLRTSRRLTGMSLLHACSADDRPAARRNRHLALKVLSLTSCPSKSCGPLAQHPVERAVQRQQMERMQRRIAADAP